MRIIFVPSQFGDIALEDGGKGVLKKELGELLLVGAHIDAGSHAALTHMLHHRIINTQHAVLVVLNDTPDEQL